MTAVSGAFVAYEIDIARLEPKFLDLYFKIPHNWKSLGGQSSGTNVRRQSLHFNQFEAHEIPLPPLVEQRRIVARIEAFAAQIDEAKRLRKEAVEDAEALIEGAGSELAQRHSKQTITIEDLVGIAGLKNGKSVKSVPDAELPRCVTLSSMRR